MRTPAREDRPPPQHDEAARVTVHCAVAAAHARSLILEQAIIYPDGWARWLADGHEYVG